MPAVTPTALPKTIIVGKLTATEVAMRQPAPWERGDQRVTTRTAAYATAMDATAGKKEWVAHRLSV